MTEPRAGSFQADVLGVLKLGTLEIQAIMRRFNKTHKQVRNAIDKLRYDHRWKIECNKGQSEWWLV